MRNTSKHHPRSTSTNPPRRGYYYSSANTQRRMQSKHNNNSHSKIEIDASVPPLKIQWNNPLEQYSKNAKLIRYLDSQKTKHHYILSTFQALNTVISDIIIKKKIKIYEINRKLQNDRIRKEKEEYEFQRNITQQIDIALMKANAALESIKYVNRQIPKIKLSITEASSKGGLPSLDKPKGDTTLSDVVEKCQDKFNTVINVNGGNMNKYLGMFAKNKNAISNIREKNRRLKQKYKNTINGVFDNVYKKMDGMDVEEIKNENDSNVESVMKVCSLLISSLFMNLYVKVFCEWENGNDNIIEKLYHLFSLWVIITHMKQVMDNNDDKTCEGMCGLNVTNVFNVKDNYKEVMDVHERYFMKEFLHKPIQMYVNTLNKNIMNSNEKEIFSDDFYKMYHTLSKIEKMKCVNYITHNINNTHNNKENTSKEELNIFRNIESIFKNNGYYCCNICKK